MSSSLLEVMRSNHELSDKLEIAIGSELDKNPVGQKAKIWQQHKVRKLVDRIVATNKELQRLYEDKDSLLKDELSTMRGNSIGSFYQAIQSTREYYLKHSSVAEIPDQEITEVEVNVPFSGEEVFGKYMDLHQLYIQFSNVIATKLSLDQDYLQYLDRFNSFFYIPDNIKPTKPYNDYLDNLWEYLSDFFKRVNPLINLDNIIEEWSKEFGEKIEKGDITTFKQNKNTSNEDPKPLRLGMFNSVEELHALGMDRLKEALEAIGLKCGGTLQDRASRLWSVRGVKPKDIPNNMKAKASKKRKINENEDSNIPAWMNHFSWREFKISAICELMMEIVVSTRKHAVKQQTRTAEEKEAELYEEEFGLMNGGNNTSGDGGKANDDDDDDAPIYNPLNLPLGWDGKPIPYWMYKLHGLGVEYKCEICGNQSYWGRRAFDRHFQEWKHAFGMRCLGVPNTKHFHDITLIEDVLALYAKIKDTISKEHFTGEVEEEFEDTQGNILNRRTYEDLARQGLL